MSKVILPGEKSKNVREYDTVSLEFYAARLAYQVLIHDDDHESTLDLAAFVLRKTGMKELLKEGVCDVDDVTWVGNETRKLLDKYK